MKFIMAGHGYNTSIRRAQRIKHLHRSLKPYLSKGSQQGNVSAEICAVDMLFI